MRNLKYFLKGLTELRSPKWRSFLLFVFFMIFLFIIMIISKVIVLLTYPFGWVHSQLSDFVYHNRNAFSYIYKEITQRGKALSKNKCNNDNHQHKNH